MYIWLVLALPSLAKFGSIYSSQAAGPYDEGVTELAPALAGRGGAGTTPVLLLRSIVPYPISQQTWNAHPTLVQYWTNVFDVGLVLNQRWVMSLDIIILFSVSGPTSTLGAIIDVHLYVPS